MRGFFGPNTKDGEPDKRFYAFDPKPDLVLIVLACRHMDTASPFPRDALSGLRSVPMVFSDAAGTLAYSKDFEPLKKALGRIPTMLEALSWRDELMAPYFSRWEPLLAYAYECHDRYPDRVAQKKFWEAVDNPESEIDTDMRAILFMHRDGA